MKIEDTLTLVAEDIYQVRLPLPFALRIVNVYLLRGADGWSLVDTGINTKEARDTWHAVFAQLGIRWQDLKQIILTHVHPDHFGLAGWLQQKALAAGHVLPIYVSPIENEQVNRVWRGEALADFEAWLRSLGMPADFARQVDKGMGNTRAMTLPHPPQLELIEPGSQVQIGQRRFLAMHAPGHSDGQLIFYDASDQLLLSGDHVLMKISPNIGLWSHAAPNPLADYMQSLESLRNLPVRLALPGHKKIITDWSGRIRELLTHHEARLNQTIDALKDGAETPFDVSHALFQIGHFTPHEWRFAMAESLAHLEYLHQRGQAQRIIGSPTLRYRRGLIV